MFCKCYDTSCPIHVTHCVMTPTLPAKQGRVSPKRVQADSLVDVVARMMMMMVGIATASECCGDTVEEEEAEE